jgi:hypothetical protein
MRAIATGIPTEQAEYGEYGRAQSLDRPFSGASGDGERWLAWVPPGNTRGAILLDTKTMTRQEIPSCTLIDGYRGQFLGSCDDGTGHQLWTIYDAQTGQRRPVPGVRPYDTFRQMGRFWVAGNDVLGCDMPHCLVHDVYVNWRSGARHENPQCDFCRSSPAGPWGYDLDARRPARLKFNPAFHGEGFTVSWQKRLVVHRRDGRETVLSAQTGTNARTGPEVCLYVCTAQVSSRRVVWTNEDPVTHTATVHAYEPARGQRRSWVFHFRAKPQFWCTGDLWLSPAPTRYALLVFAVSQAERHANIKCLFPTTYSLYAASWPS